MKSTLLFILFYLGSIYPQTDTTFNFDLFTIKLSDKTLQVLNPADKVLFQQKYNNPIASTSDLDADGIDELIISDYLEKSAKKDYILYVYSTIDSFSGSEVIYSGYFEPYITFAEEIQKNIIISGDSSLNFLNNDSELFYPLICREYDEGSFVIVNNEMYDLFISENDNIIEYLDEYFRLNNPDCNSVHKIKNAVAAGYINYLSAGEITLADHFFKNYYPCNDSLEFKKLLDKITYKDQ